MEKKPLSYKESGVDIEKGDEFVSRITKMVQSTYNAQVVSGVGGFAALYDMGDRYLSASTDGVGTKLMVAKALQKHDSIGLDLVAMCVNDLICNGSRPMFFLDYFATGKLELGVSEAVLKGVVEGCRQAQCALIGGETAEMPGLYAPGDYDLAGFSVGEVDKERAILGQDIKEGMELVGVQSSGFHSNGYSLLRKLVKESETKLMEALLVPTKIYVKPVLDLLRQHPGVVGGISHITGSGFLNIPRMNENFSYEITSLPSDSDLPFIIPEVAKRSGLDLAELYRTFNMGIGLVVAATDANLVIKHFTEAGERAHLLGKVVPGKGETLLSVKGMKGPL